MIHFLNMKVFLLCLFLVAVYAKELEGVIELTPNAKVTFKGNAPESLILAGVLSTPEDIGQRDRLRRHLTIPMVFLVAVKNPSEDLLEEMELRKDILLFKMNEKYIGKDSTPPYKVFGFFKIIQDFLPKVKYIVKMDNDMYFVDQIHTFWKPLQNWTSPFIAGRFNSLFSSETEFQRRPVARNGRWMVRQEAYDKDEFPPYPSGSMYILSRDAVDIILEQLYHSQNANIMELPEDAIVGVLSQNIHHYHQNFLMRQVDEHGKMKFCVFVLERCMYFMQSFFSFGREFYTLDNLKNATLSKTLQKPSMDLCVQLMPQIDNMMKGFTNTITINKS